MKWLIGLVAGIILCLCIAPFVIKPKILNLIRSEANKQINGTLEFNDLGISLIKSFPQACIELDNLILKDIYKDTVFATKILTVNLNLKKLLFSKQYEINEILLNTPNLKIVNQKDNALNISKLIKSENSSPKSSLSALLKKIEIIQGNIEFIDSFDNRIVRLKEVNHTSKGDLQGDFLNLKYKNQIKKIDFVQNGLYFLKGLKADLTGNILYNVNTGDWKLTENKVNLNDLTTDIAGSLEKINEQIFTDLHIDLKENELKQLLSLIPSVYTKEYNKLKANGKFGLHGSIKGVYDESHMPLLKINTSLANGKIGYSHLPYSFNDLEINVELASLDSFGSKYKISIPALNGKINQDPLSVKAEMTLNKSYLQHADANVKTNLALNQLKGILPLEGYTLDGRLLADFDISFNESQIKNKEFEKMKFFGSISGEKIKIESPGNLPLSILQIQCNLDPVSASIKFEQTNYGKSDFIGNIHLTNPVALLSEYKSLAKLNFNIKSNLVDLNEISGWICDTCILPNTGSMNTEILKYNCSFNISAIKVKYHTMEMLGTTLSGAYIHDTLKILNATTQLSGSNLNISGSLFRPYQWVYDLNPLTGNLNIESPVFDVNEYLDTSNIEVMPATYVKMLPPNTDLLWTFNSNQVIYKNFRLQQVSLNGNITNQELNISTGNGVFSGGAIKTSGVFSEVESLPTFDFKMDLNGMNISEAFLNFKSVKKFSPLAEFLGGIFTTSAVFSGSMDAGMNPVWKKFDAAGFMEIINGKFSNYGAIEEIANKIQIPILKYISWDKSKNWFSIEKGIAHIKPFIIPNKEIFIQVEGKHEIEQNIDYTITFGIPKKVFDKYKINPYLNPELVWMRTELQSKGIPIQEIDTFYFESTLAGPVLKPTVNTKWIAKPGGKKYSEQLKNDIEKALQQKADSIKENIESNAEAKRDSLLDLLKKEADIKKEQLDSIKNGIQDSLKKIAEKKTKEVIDSVIRKETTKILDSSLQSKVDTLLNKNVKEEIEKINQKLKDWNPLKKKKQ